MPLLAGEGEWPNFEPLGPSEHSLLILVRTTHERHNRVGQPTTKSVTYDLVRARQPNDVADVQPLLNRSTASTASRLPSHSPEHSSQSASRFAG